MRTMHPVLKRGGLFWDQELLPPACYAERFARIRSLIAESGDDAWLLYGDVERYGHAAYFSNFLPRTRSALALAPRSGDPAILVSVGQRDIPAAKTLTWIDDLRPFSNLARQACALINEKGLSKARFGLVGIEESVSLKEWTDIAAGLPEAQWQTRSAAAMRLRQSKDRWELAALRRSALAVAGALDAVPRIARPGMTTRQLAAAVDRELRRAAAEDVRILIASGPQCALSLRPPGDHVLQNGDPVMLYAAAEVQRYWAEAARTFVLGRASAAQQALAARAAAALAAIRAAAVPGALVSGLHDRAEARLDDAALCASARAYGYGHGIGLDPEETPFVVPGSDERVVEGATLALRVIGHSAGQGIATGQVVIAGLNGGEPLIEAPGLIECGQPRAN
jgi:Xaa-Pro aminopeptidase